MKKEELETLLSRYYDGLSTGEEERALRTFFSGEDVPEEYEAEKAIFAYFSDLQNMPEPSANFETRIISSLTNNRSDGTTRVRKLIMVLSGIAASVVIITGTWFFMKSNEHVDTYSDPHVAYAETMKILMEVSEQMNKGTEALSPVSKMNMPESHGMKVFTESRETIEKNLMNLEYVTKVIRLTNEQEKNENN